MKDAVQQLFRLHSGQLVLADGQLGKQYLYPTRNRLDRSWDSSGARGSHVLMILKPGIQYRAL